MNNTTQILSIEIETATQLIVAAARRAALAAVEEAFTSMGSLPAKKSRPARRTASAIESKVKSRKTTPSSRRTASEIAQLTERLFTAVSEEPGQTVAVMAQKLDVAPTALQVPVARLKRAERIRVIGQRQFTKYYPRTREQPDADEIQAAA